MRNVVDNTLLGVRDVLSLTYFFSRGHFSSLHFKDPHTNTIEGVWTMLKDPIKRGHGQSRSTLSGSLFEFLLRRQYRILLVFISQLFNGNISD